MYVKIWVYGILQLYSATICALVPCNALSIDLYDTRSVYKADKDL